MIKNERQFKITRAQIRRMRSAIQELSEPGRESSLPQAIILAQRDALGSQLADLEVDVRTYEDLKTGKRSPIAVRSLAELPHALVMARIAAKMSQRELAARLSLKEQQIQRYEATDYAGASLARLREIAQALSVTLAVTLPQDDIPRSILIGTMEKLGLCHDFVRKRLLPVQLSAPLLLGKKVSDTGGIYGSLNLMAILERVFGLDVGALHSDQDPAHALVSAAEVRFKTSRKSGEKRVTAYTVYAHYLAMLLLEATVHLAAKPVPRDPAIVRRHIVDAFGSITLETALRFVWGLGIPVLPLNDRGEFQGAYWRIANRSVIALKQKTPSQGRWLFDLLHELGHASSQPPLPELTVLESGEMVDKAVQAEEEAASQYAGDIILDGRAEALVQMCVKEARGSVEGLKRAVPLVAHRQNVAVDGLANYMAFRLSLQGINWWGAAHNLQEKGRQPWAIARDILMQNVRLGGLNELDRGLLLQALTDLEEPYHGKSG